VLEGNFTGLVTQPVVDLAVLRHALVCNCNSTFNCASFWLQCVTLALDGEKLLSSRSGRFTLGRKTPVPTEYLALEPVRTYWEK